MKIVEYLRVSTSDQEESQLGLKGQRTGLDNYVASVHGEVIGTYQDVESGSRNTRVEMLKAIAHAKAAGARLVIAKLDRLSRNVAFMAGLMESGVDFIAVDNPFATPLTIHILSAVAEDELRRIRTRTKTALDEIKREIADKGFYISRNGNRITSLGAGSGHWKDPARAEQMKAGLAKGRAVAVTMQRGSVSVNMVLPAMREMRASNLTYRQIAERLNAEGVTTRLGGKWCAGTVLRAMRKTAA